MRTLVIDLDNLEKSMLLIDFYVILQSLYEGRPLKSWIDEIKLLEIEESGYIKILDLHNFEYEPREKLIQLFKKSEKNIEASTVISYLNAELKKKNPNLRGFSANSSANIKFINARLLQGYTVEDLKSVIDVMIKEWWGTKMQEYLRPETLFNETKFQTYINKVGNSSDNQFNPIEMC